MSSLTALNKHLANHLESFSQFSTNSRINNRHSNDFKENDNDNDNQNSNSTTKSRNNFFNSCLDDFLSIISQNLESLLYSIEIYILIVLAYVFLFHLDKLFFNLTLLFLFVIG